MSGENPPPAKPIYFADLPWVKDDGFRKLYANLTHASATTTEIIVSLGISDFDVKKDPSKHRIIHEADLYLPPRVARFLAMSIAAQLSEHQALLEEADASQQQPKAESPAEGPPSS
jgi:hypothetical protein